jgi:hypothetical protein
VNALRSLLERHDHIVQEVDGQNDFGDDLYVTFTELGQVTADMIRVQVKGGSSWRTASGYAVPVGHHGEAWRNGNVPVYCVIYDPQRGSLYWANATQELISARHERRALKTVAVSAGNILDDNNLPDFVLQARHYVGRYRGGRAIRSQLSEMSGVEFGSSDAVLHFVSSHEEHLIFWQRPGEGYATLLHGDLDWIPRYVGPEMLRFDGLPNHLGTPTVADIILNRGEGMWLAACFHATEWMRQPSPDLPRPGTRSEVRDSYVTRRIRDRLWLEPDALTRSVAELRAKPEADPELFAALDATADDVLDETLTASWEQMLPTARRLATRCLVRQVVEGAPILPLDEQFQIVWRWRRPWGEYSFSARVDSPSTRMAPRREIALACSLRPGDRVYWLSRFGNERGRLVVDTWASNETPGAI